jgi:acetolactate decarboxylase
MQTKTKWAFTLALIVIVGCVAFFAGWQINPASKPQETQTLFQLAAFNSFAEGNYSGVMAFSDLAKHGDFGIGTLDGLDGEMIALDGVFYQVPASGVPVEVPADATAPYATITFFKPNITFTVTEPMNYSQLKTRIDDALPSQNAIYAIKVTATYDWAQTRSPHKQSEPYQPLTQALTNQAVFTLNNVSATAVGFRFPSSMDGVDYAGYHLHLITDDRQAGGHLLDCIAQNITVQIDQINNYNLVLP